MSITIAATFASRRDADMAVERLVQEFGIERTDIFVAADGVENSAGVVAAGADAEDAAPGSPPRDDGAHYGGVTVSVDANEDGLVAKIEGALAEFDGRVEPRDEARAS